MAEARFDIEQLLRNALAPVEPSASLSERPRSLSTSWPTGSWRPCAIRATGAARLLRS
jgi:hypothetical protein